MAVPPNDANVVPNDAPSADDAAALRKNETLIKKVVLSWSSGQDCSFALHVLRTDPAYASTHEVVGLLSTVNESVTPRRVAMHGTREALVRLQAERACSPGKPPLELHLVPLPSPCPPSSSLAPTPPPPPPRPPPLPRQPAGPHPPCPNAVYEERMGAAVSRLAASGVGAVAFGDIFLADVRAYREEKMRGTGLECLSPLWPRGKDTKALAREMVAAGLRATLVCVDPRRLPPSFAGRTFDAGLLDDLERLRREEEAAKVLKDESDNKGKGEEEADGTQGGEKGEAGAAGAKPNGEFHTFCWAGPAFSSPIDLDTAPEPVELNGFVFCDVAPRGEMAPEDFRAAAAEARALAAERAEALARSRKENEFPVQTVARAKEEAAKAAKAAQAAAEGEGE